MRSISFPFAVFRKREASAIHTFKLLWNLTLYNWGWVNCPIPFSLRLVTNWRWQTAQTLRTTLSRPNPDLPHPHWLWDKLLYSLLLLPDNLGDHSQIPLSPCTFPRCSFLTWPTLLSGQFLAILAEYAETSLLAAAISFAKAMSSFLDRWGWPSSASLWNQWKVPWAEDFNIKSFYRHAHVESSDPKHTS